MKNKSFYIFLAYQTFKKQGFLKVGYLFVLFNIENDKANKQLSRSLVLESNLEI